MVTPIVAQFAEKTIQEIEEVIATIEDEHKVAEAGLQKVYDQFTTMAPQLKQMTTDVGEFQGKVTTLSGSHKTCRDAQVPLMQTEKQCRDVEADLKLKYESDERTLTATYHSIKGRWCPSEYDEMDEGFFASNENDMANYIVQKDNAKASKKAYEEKKAECDLAQKAREEKQAECDNTQDSLEFQACEYATSAVGVNQHIETAWRELHIDYEEASANALADAEDRKKEFTGVTIVKCLLQQIEQNQLAGMPCNETHADEVNGGIQSCHNQDIDTNHLTITPQALPASPDLANMPHAPCDGGFLAENYAQLNSEVLPAVEARCSPCPTAEVPMPMEE